MISVTEAIALLEKSLRVHEKWIRFFEAEPAAEQELRPQVEVAGSVAHHRQCVEEYTQVIECLRAFEARL